MDSKEKVLAACQRLWQERGVRDFTMDELAAEAGLSKRTVYKYYRSKEEIINAVVDCMMEDMAAVSERILNQEGEPQEMFQEIMSYLFIRAGFITSKRSLEDMMRYYPHIWQKINEFRSRRLEHMLTVVTGREGISTPPGVDIRIATAIVKSSITTILDPRFLLENGFTFQEAIQQVFRMLIMMLGYNPGDDGLREQRSHA